ncbi:coproporphyrinogen III oxidase family protein [Shewanella sp. GXUN23E]|uniref:coproporphyrinogen III oxidase family protein n=1 Tax=Shewanella sp. GXUN23E TaxID=3422498 RepID=UPI003D7D04B6
MDTNSHGLLSVAAVTTMDKVMNRQIRCSLSLANATALTEPPQVPDTPIETLYVHIPFCHTLCRYCSFHKVKFDESLARAYFVALRQEITAVLRMGYRFNRVYLGGGTTTILEDELIKTIELIRSMTPIREVTCESDPFYFRQGNPEHLRGLIDRMSIGVQSFEDRILKATGRFEKFGSGREQADYISQAIQLFPTVNLDMMYGFAGQTPDSVYRDLEQAMALAPEQITTYPLTPGIGKNRKKCAPIMGPDRYLWHQFISVRHCLGQSFDQQFPWNFNRRQPGLTAHKYVLDGEDCLGVGSGAFGRFGQRFFVSSFDIHDYIAGIHANPNLPGIRFEKQLDSKALRRHELMIMMGHGYLDAAQFKAHSGQNLWQALPLEMAYLMACGALAKQGINYRVTEFGQFLALKMFAGFLSGMDYLREQASAGCHRYAT